MNMRGTANSPCAQPSNAQIPLIGFPTVFWRGFRQLSPKALLKEYGATFTAK